MRLIKPLNPYQIAIFLATLSLCFGIVREFIILYLFGLTTENDHLQLFLTIFYTVSLSIDALRLSCLNLYLNYSMSYIICSASIISLPFTIILSMIIDHTSGGLDKTLLAITICGSYLNLIAVLLMSYKQRGNYFLLTQCINILPNFIIIPGILLIYCCTKINLTFSIVILVSIIPLLQCILLFMLPNKNKPIANQKNSSLLEGVTTVARHFLTMSGEQLFQIIIRSAFFNFGAGYLSLFAIAIRIYSSIKFILIDTFIGSKLVHWKIEMAQNDFLSKQVNSNPILIFFAIISLIICLQNNLNLIYFSLQMTCILMVGFYFSTLLRVIYFKINYYENNVALTLRFAFYEFMFAFLAFIVSLHLNFSVLSLLWLGYIAKPCSQLIFTRKKYNNLALNTIKELNH